MLAYANPTDRTDELKRADGYGIVRFNKAKRTVTLECWPRFVDARMGDKGQFPGWPLTFAMQDNDGRKPTGWLPELHFPTTKSAVVQVVDEKTGETLYTVRTDSQPLPPPRLLARSIHAERRPRSPDNVSDQVVGSGRPERQNDDFHQVLRRSRRSVTECSGAR